MCIKMHLAFWLATLMSDSDVRTWCRLVTSAGSSRRDTVQVGSKFKLCHISEVSVCLLSRESTSASSWPPLSAFPARRRPVQRGAGLWGAEGLLGSTECRFHVDKQTWQKACQRTGLTSTSLTWFFCGNYYLVQIITQARPQLCDTYVHFASKCTKV